MYFCMHLPVLLKKKKKKKLGYMVCARARVAWLHGLRPCGGVRVSLGYLVCAPVRVSLGYMVCLALALPRVAGGSKDAPRWLAIVSLI